VLQEGLAEFAQLRKRKFKFFAMNSSLIGELFNPFEILEEAIGLGLPRPLQLRHPTNSQSGNFLTSCRSRILGIESRTQIVSEFVGANQHSIGELFEKVINKFGSPVKDVSKTVTQ
jgi:hypothetical protein